MNGSSRPDYGLDAPPVVRNLLLVAVAGLAAWSASAARLWSGVIAFPVGRNDVRVEVAPAGLSIGLACLAMAAWMIWGSKVGKLRERERLLDTVAWTGGEQVLDVGCGRGLMLVGAARRLAAGRATGIDLWRAGDLEGNTPSAVRYNIAAERVDGQVGLTTGDMRMLPFADGTFDVVLSRAAVHNVPDAQGRRRAIEEVARVLRPGGRVVLSDIRCLEDYAAVLRARGFSVSVGGSAVGRVLLMLLTFGALRPGVLDARRPGFVPSRAGR